MEITDWQAMAKIEPSSDVSTLQTSSLPVFPDSQPLVTLPAPPTLAELETAQALVKLHDNQWDSLQQASTTPSVSTLELQEPSVSTIDRPIELVIENPPVTTEEQLDNVLADAMDKIVEHTDVSYTEPWYWIKFCDCMDLITGRMSELVETVNLFNLTVFDQIETKPCTVDLVWIKFTPTLKLPILKTEQDLLSLGQHFTRIKAKEKEGR